MKYQNGHEYLNASIMNSNYNNFMLLSSKFSLNFKLINLYAYQNQNLTSANILFNNLKAEPFIGTSMDNFLYIFDIPTVS